ncbi:hypothetical protein KY284_034508 [Solanum tuberosum]|nr:hypothetical protein KY284_034508 [Solanum tuberosum]
MSLQNLKQDDLPVTQYLQKAKLISDELAAVGRPLCLADLNIYIFKGLRSDFKDLVTALSARPEPMTYSELHSLLLNHEFILGHTLSSLTVSPLPHTDQHVAHFSQRSNTTNDRSQNNTSNYRGRGRNSRGRGGRGGRFSSSRNNLNGQPWQPSLDSKARCQICNGTNHLANTCFQRYSHTINPSAYLSHQAPIPLTQSWFPNTGATNHIMPDLSDIHQAGPYKGVDQLQVGNEAGLPIHHTVVDLSSSSSLHNRTNFQPTNPPCVPKSIIRTHTIQLRHMPPSSNLAVASSSPAPPTSEPRCFTIANRSLEWRDAMACEMTALLHNKTWSLVSRIPSMNVLGCKWVF